MPVLCWARGRGGRGYLCSFQIEIWREGNMKKWRKDRDKVIARGRKLKSRSSRSDPSLVPDPSTQTVHLPAVKCSSHHSSAPKLLEAHSGRRINSSSLLFVISVSILSVFSTTNSHSSPKESSPSPEVSICFHLLACAHVTPPRRN